MKIVALALATSFLALGLSACSESKPEAAKPAATLASTAKPATSAPVAPAATAAPGGGW
jgi:hypothetical protein